MAAAGGRRERRPVRILELLDPTLCVLADLVVRTTVRHKTLRQEIGEEADAKGQTSGRRRRETASISSLSLKSRFPRRASRSSAVFFLSLVTLPLSQGLSPWVHAYTRVSCVCVPMRMPTAPPALRSAVSGSGAGGEEALRERERHSHTEDDCGQPRG